MTVPLKTMGSGPAAKSAMRSTQERSQASCLDHGLLKTLIYMMPSSVDNQLTKSPRKQALLLRLQNYHQRTLPRPTFLRTSCMLNTAKTGLLPAT